MSHDTTRLSALAQRLNQIDAVIGHMYDVRKLVLDDYQAEQARVYDSTPLGRDRYVRPSGERREQAVRCLRCPNQTWALDSLCDPCYVEHGAVAS